MPTFNIYIRRDEREDKKYPVAIRITQNKQHAYIQTGIYVVKQQLSKEFALKDKNLSLVVLGKIREYEKMILQDLGGDISSYSAKSFL